MFCCCFWCEILSIFNIRCLTSRMYHTIDYNKCKTRILNFCSINFFATLPDPKNVRNFFLDAHLCCEVSLNFQNRMISIHCEYKSFQIKYSQRHVVHSPYFFCLIKCIPQKYLIILRVQRT